MKFVQPPIIQYFENSIPLTHFKTAMITHYHLHSETIYSQLALSILKIGNYLQIPNEIMKNQVEKKIHKQNKTK